MGTIPVIGLNSDITRSTDCGTLWSLTIDRSKGELCIQRHVNVPVKEAIERYFEGRYKEIIRTRLRVTIREGEAQQYIHPHRALNDVFYAESTPFRLSAFLDVVLAITARRSSHYSVKLDDSDPKRHKGSGFLVFSGTGSTAWFIFENWRQMHLTLVSGH